MSQLQRNRIVPSAAVDLAFAIDVPADWTIEEVPPPSSALDTPADMYPLVAFHSPSGEAILTVYTQGVMKEGSLGEWLEELCQARQIKTSGVTPMELSGVPGLLADGSELLDEELVRVRMALLEDGWRLVNLEFRAHTSAWTEYEPLCAEILRSFQLEDVFGPMAGQNESVQTPTSYSACHDTPEPPRNAPRPSIAAD